LNISRYINNIEGFIETIKRTAELRSHSRRIIDLIGMGRLDEAINLANYVATYKPSIKQIKLLVDACIEKIKGSQSSNSKRVALEIGYRFCKEFNRKLINVDLIEQEVANCTVSLLNQPLVKIDDLKFITENQTNTSIETIRLKSNQNFFISRQSS